MMNCMSAENTGVAHSGIPTMIFSLKISSLPLTTRAVNSGILSHT